MKTYKLKDGRLLDFRKRAGEWVLKVNPDLSQSFPIRLRIERKRLGYSQSKVSELCGVVKDVWGRYERGDSSPTVTTLYRFMQLGADITYLFTNKRMANDK